MYGKLVSVMYALNVIFDAFFTLLIPAGLCFIIAWLLVSFAGAPAWIYAPFLIVGVLLGLISMVKFILTAMAGYERLEKQREEARKARTESKRNESAESVSPVSDSAPSPSAEENRDESGASSDEDSE